MEIRFSKLQACGNDVILIDEWDHAVIPDDMKGQFAAIYCDRRFGIGADMVIYLMKSETCDIRMRLLRPDESEAGADPEGIRCLAKFAYDAGYVKDTCTVQTYEGERKVSMGYKEEEFFASLTLDTPRFNRDEIPATGTGEYKEEIAGYTVYAVNTGTPQAVIIVDSVDAVDIDTIAPQIRHHATFPEGADVNFVERTGKDSIRIRTFGQGIEGETLSCSAGAAASAALVHWRELAGDVVEVETRGGPLTISLKETTALEGPATTVFAGTILF